MIWKLDSAISQLEQHSFLEEYGLSFYIKRDDQIHPLISGNKSRKLKYFLKKFYAENHDGIITFGGAFSNHLLAVSEACFELKIPCLGFIRGDELTIKSNSILAYCNNQNMQLVFLERKEYDVLKNSDIIINNNFKNPLIIPEGANNFLGSLGFDDVKNQIPFLPDYLITSVGSGATFNGLVELYKDLETNIIGIASLKKDAYLEKLAIEKNQKIFFTDYSFGGFDGKIMTFIVRFYNKYNIVLDPVYTAKTLIKIEGLAKENFFKKNDKIVFLHTGGITGLLSPKAWLMLKKTENSGNLIENLSQKYPGFYY